MPQCDSCAAIRPCVSGPLWVCGLETYACHVCRGDDECDACAEEAEAVVRAQESK